MFHSKKTSPVIQYDNSLETDKQMLIRIGKKFALIFVLILMSDTLFDWVLGLLDLMLEGFHILIEAVEYFIEVILEHAFHTSHQQSEIIIVNGTVIISIYLIYRLCIASPKLCSMLRDKCLLHLDHKSSNWQATPLSRKIKLSSTYCLGISCILFFLTL